MRQGWMATAAAMAIGLVGGTGGCVVREERRRPPPPPEPAVDYEPAPAPLVEVVPVAPGPEYVWVGGRYYREHDRWEWHRGHYDQRYR